MLLAIRLERARNYLSYEMARKMLMELTRLPGQIQYVLDERDCIREIAEQHAKSNQYFFIGRDTLDPIALEGALKMKEISYISAEGYPAGELKHGPLALITDGTPVRALATHGKKVQANIKEVRAISADVIAFASEGDPDISKIVTTVVEIPEARLVFDSILCSVALQHLAYYTADARELPIDKPRNLAKSVTVEGGDSGESQLKAVEYHISILWVHEPQAEALDLFFREQFIVDSDLKPFLSQELRQCEVSAVV